MYICEFTNPSLHDVLLLSNTAWPRATPIVSFTCVDIDYTDDEGWRQVEDLFGRIRNCGESGGHTDTGALIACTHSIGGQRDLGSSKGLSVEGSCMW